MMKSPSSTEEEAKAAWLAAENVWLTAYLTARDLRDKADKAKEKWIEAARHASITPAPEAR